MTIKPITSATVTRINKAKDSKLRSLLDWLNHTEHAEAFEEAGRLYYRVHVTIGRNITEIKELSTKYDGTSVVVDWSK
jgi:hypothetical protein